MNAAASPEASWSRRRWTGVVTAVVALQAAFVFLISDRAPSVRHDHRQNLSACVIADASSNRKLLDVLGVGDPSLLALINPQPFTAGRPAFKEPEEPAPWDLTEPDRPLGHSPVGLGTVFTDFMRTNAAFTMASESKPLPVPMEPPDSAPLVARNSRLEFGEGLAGRPLLGPTPFLPSWTNTDLVTNTVVRVTLSPDGEVFSPRLASGTATTPVQHQADLAALAIARSLRFQPPATSVETVAPGLGRGILIFHWHTVEPPPDGKPPVN
jgi:hypothetical protein